ncbi:MAG TPA: potassium/proton antiporter [Aggregatilineales bacterium]|nr:potassium/proton antiporter [Aggregatilineales bacterium]
MIPIELILLFSGGFLCLAALASKLAAYSGVPALLLFLGMGMLAGSDGLGGINFDYPAIVQALGVVALVYILFSGGLDTQWDEIKPVMKQGLLLATLGVFITALSVAVFVHLLFDFSFYEGLLLGAIISSTDAAAVFTILRAKSVHLRGKLKPLLELESGSNDPMAVVLMLGMLTLIQHPDTSVFSLIVFFIQQMVLGALFGVLLGVAMVRILNTIRLDYDGLYPVLTLALVALVYSVTALFSGNGFLAAYIAGLVMGNQKFVHQRSLLRFHDGMAWLMQIVMFLTLGLQIFPSRLVTIAPIGLAIGVFLIFVARPLSVFVGLALFKMPIKEKLFISWVGLRGAAPVILATFPLLYGVDKADTIFHLVFFIVLSSVMIQAPLLIRMARWLGVYDTDYIAKKSPLAVIMDEDQIVSDMFELTIPPNADVVGKSIVELQLPKDVLVMLIGRSTDVITPNGNTQMEAYDRVLLYAPKKRHVQMQRYFKEIPTSDNQSA